MNRSPMFDAPPVLFGRDAELRTLRAAFDAALAGRGTLALVAGEAGIGKTTVLDLWWSHLEGRSAVWLGRGQCAEHYGEGEPYLPVLEALGQLSRGPAGPALRAVLRRGVSWAVSSCQEPLGLPAMTSSSRRAA